MSEDTKEAAFIGVFVIALFAFGLGFYLNIPDEHGYSVADIQALNDLTVEVTKPDDWLSQVVSEREAGHAQ